MARSYNMCLLAVLLIVAFLTINNEKMIVQARHLLDTKLPELPPLHLPKVELPPLPHFPDLSKPDLPHLPDLSKPGMPHFPDLPKPDLPHLPEFPKLPKPTLPTIPALPKDLPLPSLPHP